MSVRISGGHIGGTRSINHYASLTAIYNSPLNFSLHVKMVNYCRVIGCHNNSTREKDRHFYRLPEIITNQCKKTSELSTERRRLWLARLQQDFSGKNLKNIRVCSDHFVSSKLMCKYLWINNLNVVIIILYHVHVQVEQSTVLVHNFKHWSLIKSTST